MLASLRFACVASLLLSSALLSAAAEKPRAPRFHWTATGAFNEKLDLTNTGIDSRGVMVYEHDFGLIPRFWKGTAERGGVPQQVNLTAHIDKLRKDMARLVPDPNFNGAAIIDLEAWGPLWKHAPEDARAMSIRLAAADHPDRTPREHERLAEAQWNSAAKNLLLATLRECKALRPRAIWGFYAWPGRGFDAQDIEKTRWLWSAVDAVYPECYMVFKSAEKSDRQKGLERPEDFIQDTQGKIERSRLAADGRIPVYAIVMPRYHDLNGIYGEQFVQDSDLDLMFRIPLEAGADGLAFWDVIKNDQDVSDYREQFIERITPALRRAASR